jgi:cystathionine beta-lyase/cystathionine gamma-synthase
MTKRSNRRGLRTTAIHAGEAPDPETGASAPSLVMSTTYALEGAQLDAYRAFAGDGVSRFSVGLEDPEDLCADLERVL